MKKIKILIVLIIQIFLSGAILAQKTSTPDSLKFIQEFRVKTEAWKDAYNSLDARNLVPLYSEDARYISSHVEGLVASGRDRLIANFQNGMSGGGHIDSIEILKMEYSCELATLFCKYQATNSGITVVGRNLLVMKRIKGNWFIVLHMTVV